MNMNPFSSNARSLLFDPADPAPLTIARMSETVETQEHPCLWVAHAYDGRPDEFLASLPDDPTDVAESLLAKNVWLLVLAKPTTLDLMPLRHYRYVEPELPWEEPILRQYYPETYTEIARGIRELRTKGRWDEPWAQTERLAQEHLLGEMIAERSAHGWSTPRQGPVDVLDDQPLEAAIQFVASYFSEPGQEETLSPEDFQRVLRRLLGDRTSEEKVKTANGSEGVSIIRTPLVDIWQSKSQILTNQCGLSVIKTSGGVLTTRTRSRSCRIA